MKGYAWQCDTCEKVKIFPDGHDVHSMSERRRDNAVPDGWYLVFQSSAVEEVESATYHFDTLACLQVWATEQRVKEN